MLPLSSACILLRRFTAVCAVLVIFVLCVVPVCAQELNCTVMLDSRQIQTQEQQIINQLRESIQTFMNTTKFTNEDIKTNERIKCTFFITLTAGAEEARSTNVAQGRYAATLQVQASRPVYNSTYESPLITIFDQNFIFSYQPAQPLIFAENANTNNLTSMLAYYAYVILALDFDSFADKGGSALLERLLNIGNIAQQTGGFGWDRNNNRNRYWFSENLNSPQFTPFREAMYLYHRKGLDMMSEDPEQARKSIAEAIENIGKVNQVRPADALIIDAFLDAKRNEILGIFSQGNADMLRKVSQTLTRIDPQNGDKYRALVK